MAAAVEMARQLGDRVRHLESGRSERGLAESNDTNVIALLVKARLRRFQSLGYLVNALYHGAIHSLLYTC